jgi:hypothetical protein
MCILRPIRSLVGGWVFDFHPGGWWRLCHAFYIAHQNKMGRGIGRFSVGLGCYAVFFVYEMGLRASVFAIVMIFVFRDWDGF